VGGLMKKLSLYIIIFCILTGIPLLLPAETCAQESNSIVVEEANICRGVINRKPLGIGDTFAASVGKLYCFTKVITDKNHTEISYIWYFGDLKRAEIKLPVKSSKWRTYSSKKIQIHETGDWHVDVVGPLGKVLKTLRFKIIP
jgi:hypothetical protein